MPFCQNPSISQMSSEQMVCEDEGFDIDCVSDLGIFESTISGFENIQPRAQIFAARNVPNIEHEVHVAKSILQQCSSITGDNLFDHLAKLIKRILQDRPDNIVDFFEEFSYNIREQKFRLPETFPWVFYKMPDLSRIIHFEGRPDDPPDDIYDVCEEERKSLAKQSKITRSHTDVSDGCQRLLIFDENVLRQHLHWALCGLGLLTDEVLHLSCALQKIQYQPNVEHARFWGKIYTLKEPYYIVEAILAKEEMELRLDQMREEMAEMISLFRNNSDGEVNTDADCELIPGVSWQDCPPEELARMRPDAAPIPKPRCEIKFDIPPEAVGTGLNRLSYFVVNSLHDEWFELPIVTPKQIQVSRHIKKLFTGDLEARVNSFPPFPGVEKHYLRATIARITSGTYVAPIGFYRKLTKKERMELYGEEFEEVIFDDEGEEEEEDTNNDAPIIENSDYQPLREKLLKTCCWVHYRPAILSQGRVVYFDEEGARRALEREARLRMKAEEEANSEEMEEFGEENGEEDQNEENEPEVGPPLFRPCRCDQNDENVTSWSPRMSSVYNHINRLYTLRSNLWPGAIAYTIDKYCDNVYLGWGMKYVGRNMKIKELPEVFDDYPTDRYVEATDPTPEMEEAWRLYMLSKEQVIEEFIPEELEEIEEPC